MESKLVEPMRKKSRLKDMANADMDRGYSRAPMYDEYYFIDTPCDRASVRNRNWRKEREDGR